MARKRNGALGFDPAAAARSLEKSDPKMAWLVGKVGPMRLELGPLHNPFDALVHSITYQQLNGKAAATILGRVCALFPDPEHLDPRVLARLSDAKLRGAGLSRNKLLALKDLAAKTLDGTVPTFKELTRLADDEIVERLTQVRGIGRWTAQMLLMFRLGRPDVLPVDDYGVRKGFALLHRKRKLPAPKDLLRHGERWRPYRSAASWYLWRALELPEEAWDGAA